jgi:hypothetical protein
LRSPGNVAVGSGGVLLRLLVGGESLGLDRVSAEPEELLGGDEVPAKYVSSRTRPTRAWLL